MLSLTLLNESDKLVLIQLHTFLGFLMPDSRDMVAGIFTLQKVRNGFYEWSKIKTDSVGFSFANKEK